MFFSKLKKITYIILLVILYSSLGVYATKKCRDKDSKKCKVINYISYPTFAFLKSAQQTNNIWLRYKQTGVFETSGLLAKDNINSQKRFSNLKPGFNFYYEPNKNKNNGYLLLSYYNSIIEKPSVEIWNLNSQEKVHEYRFNFKELEKVTKTSFNKSRTIRFNHPLLLRNGNLILRDQNQFSLYKFDICGKLLKVLKIEEVKLHHALEKDINENIYIATQRRNHLDKSLFSKHFLEDGFAIFDSDLNLIKEYSLLKIYSENGLSGDLFGRLSLENDPFHLNDVQPYIYNGNEIVLLSIKGHSRILAYDLKLDKVLWFIDRSVFNQHDIDIDFESSNDKKISFSIFDNNSFFYSNSKGKSFGNRIVSFKGLPTKWNGYPESIGDKKQFQNYSYNILNLEFGDSKFNPITVTEGLHDFSKNKDKLMIEETNYGRILEIDKNKKILWQFINKNPNTNAIYMTNWSRRLDNLPNGFKDKVNRNCSIEE